MEGLSIQQDQCTKHFCFFVCTACDFLLFTLNVRNKQKLTAWEEADYVFFCAAFHLFVFGWLWNAKPKYDGNGFPGGGGRREQRTPSSGLAYNYRLEGRRARKKCDRMRRTPATLAMNSMCFGLCSPEMGDPEMLEHLWGKKPLSYLSNQECIIHRWVALSTGHLKRTLQSWWHQALWIRKYEN